MPRLFVSVDLPDRLADAFAAVQDHLRDVESLRFTDPERAHCTLKFLGDTDGVRVGDVVEALEAAVDATDVSPFDVEVGGLGVFPSTDYISVVWTGVRDGYGAAELGRLAEAVERETVALGFDEADHGFTPHFTLARMDDARGKGRVLEYLDEDPTVGWFEAGDVRLTESTLTDDGPEYETRERVSL
ncbi:RNA 2',3'-cyclic phosphodiesterase [Halobaculum sp. WSA2]|uniref:RNA 2',3'-cyclic phosphodiesterase n=1 Tax=Halobaculum saliterrae TaxID=2073113 RepID=A0A6B0SWA5_9EURY|nr:RNA 2',3'-cyclic phosphodiesterase [Halobaculum saliterrae]MXR42935.1 RNA 2',3'-cyclic phosphodiesterase [Halobaculum saliterrae]